MIRSFTDLEAWKVAHNLVLQVYKVTRAYPKEEIFALVTQSRRAGVSVTSNIAEGFGRKTAKDKIHFYMMANTSAAEMHNQLILARDLVYISPQEFLDFENQISHVGRLLTGLCRSASDK